MRNIEVREIERTGVTKDKCLDYLLCFILFSNMETVYFKRNDISSAVFEITLCVTLIAYLVFASSENRINNKYYGLVGGVSFVYMLVLLMAFFHGGNNSVLSNMLQKIVVFCALLPLFLLVLKKKGFGYVKTVLLVRYVNTFCVFAFAGFMLWILDAIGISLPTISVPFTWGGSRVGDGILGLTFNITLSDQAFSQGLYRFTFLLVEGPFAISYFALAAIIEMSCNKYPRFYIVLFLTVCIVCSFTGFGMLMAAPVLVLGLLTSQKVKKVMHGSPIAFFGYGIALFSLVIFAPLISISLLGQKDNTSSTSLHIADFIGGFRAFKDSPLLGFGIGNYSPLHYYSDNGIAGTSSALMMGVVQGGLLFVLSVLLPLLGAFFNACINDQFRFALLPLFAIIFYVNGLTDNSPIFPFIISICIYYLTNERKVDKISEMVIY